MGRMAGNGAVGNIKGGDKRPQKREARVRETRERQWEGKQESREGSTTVKLEMIVVSSQLVN